VALPAGLRLFKSLLPGFLNFAKGLASDFWFAISINYQSAKVQFFGYIMF
jgi:hypothetical protein